MSARRASFVFAVLVAVVASSIVSRAAAALPRALEAGGPGAPGEPGPSGGWTGHFSK